MTTDPRKMLLTALFIMALSGLLLHYRIHNFMVAAGGAGGESSFDSTLFLSFLLPLIDVAVVTLLFCSKRTSVYGCLLNGLIVIYGTVLMGHFSIAELTAKGAPLRDWFIGSTLPDIGISWGDFFVGVVLHELNMKQ